MESGRYINYPIARTEWFSDVSGKGKLFNSRERYYVYIRDFLINPQGICNKYV